MKMQTKHSESFKEKKRHFFKKRCMGFSKVTSMTLYVHKVGFSITETYGAPPLITRYTYLNVYLPNGRCKLAASGRQ